MTKNNDHNRNGGSDRTITNKDGVDTGKAVGTVGGGAVGAVVGSALGPVGTVVGGIVGASLGNKVGKATEDNDNDTHRTE
ncbi:MAG TPA: glycine zipper 2TM domain-containing protein [Paenibacillus sp.]|jgi:phage tail tape-measure protein